MHVQTLRMRRCARVFSAMAAQVSDADVCCWAYEAQAAQLRAALSDNAELIHTKDSHQRTALHWACVSGRTEIVKLLIYLGADVSRL